VKEWSDETEIFARTGAVRRGGSASVTVASAANEQGANAIRNKLRDSGFPATVVRAGQAFDARIDALGDQAEAAALAERLRRIGFAQAQPTR
jgi:hypothetical protein